jgi:hypothetical protein
MMGVADNSASQSLYYFAPLSRMQPALTLRRAFLFFPFKPIASSRKNGHADYSMLQALSTKWMLGGPNARSRTLG